MSRITLTHSIMTDWQILTLKGQLEALIDLSIGKLPCLAVDRN